MAQVRALGAENIGINCREVIRHGMTDLSSGGGCTGARSTVGLGRPRVLAASRSGQNPWAASALASALAS